MAKSKSFPLLYTMLLLNPCALLGPTGLVSTGFAAKPAQTQPDPASQGLLGCGLEDVQIDGKGKVRIKTVVPGFAAYHAGLQAGDLVLSYQGRQPADASQFSKWVRLTKPGTLVDLKILRQGNQQQLKVRVSSRQEFVNKGPENYLGKKAPPLYAFRDAKGTSANIAISENNRPRLLKLWATWCPVCRKAWPHFERIAGKYPGVDYLAVSTEPLTQTSEYAKNQAIRTPQLQSDEAKLHIAYWADAVPTYVLIDRNGKIAFAQSGYHPQSIIQALENQKIGSLQ